MKIGSYPIKPVMIVEFPIAFFVHSLFAYSILSADSDSSALPVIPEEEKEDYF